MHSKCTPGILCSHAYKARPFQTPSASALTKLFPHPTRSLIARHNASSHQTTRARPTCHPPWPGLGSLTSARNRTELQNAGPTETAARQAGHQSRTQKRNKGAQTKKTRKLKRHGPARTLGPEPVPENRTSTARLGHTTYQSDAPIRTDKSQYGMSTRSYLSEPYTAELSTCISAEDSCSRPHPVAQAAVSVSVPDEFHNILHSSTHLTGPAARP